MKASKRKTLERLGFKVGTVQEFLDLSDEEMAVIDLKIQLIDLLKYVRSEKGVSQHGLATMIGSSQSRVAKIEAGGADVSLDLICRALFALGISQQELGKNIGRKRAA